MNNPILTVSCYAIMSCALFLTVTKSPEVEGLTAFGKSTPTEKSPDQRTHARTPKGRECKTNDDCTGIGTTTCVLDKVDGKKRCLCKDQSAPVNGQCIIAKIAPGKTCTEHNDCVVNAECQMNNRTLKKLCNCKEGFAEEEEDDKVLCSGAAVPVLSSFLAVVAICLSSILAAPWGQRTAALSGLQTVGRQ